METFEAPSKDLPRVLENPEFVRLWRSDCDTARRRLNTLGQTLRDYRRFIRRNPRETLKDLYAIAANAPFPKNKDLNAAEQQLKHRIKEAARSEKAGLKREIRHARHRIRLARRKLKKRHFNLLYAKP